MDYGELIKEAFWIAFRNRFLWLFGLFAGIGAALGSFNSGSAPSRSGGNSERGDGAELNSALAFAFRELQQWVSENLTLIVAAGALVLLVSLFFVVLGVISNGALAESVATVDRGGQRRFSSAWSAGLSNFWRVLGLGLIFFLIWVVSLLVIGGPIVLLSVSAAADSITSRALAAFDATFVVGLLVNVIFIPLGVIGQFALRELVVSGERVFASVGGGYRIFRRNLGRSLLVRLIQAALGIGVGIVLAIAAILVGLVLALPAIVILLVGGLSTAAIAGFVVAGLIWFALILVVSAALGTFFHAYWTLATCD